MDFKLLPLEIPSNEPFRYDALNRESSIEFLTSLVEELKGPFVLAIDSPWGTGKTTFINMWKAHLELDNYICIYFNSWESDFTADPLIAFLGEIENFVKKIDPVNTEFSHSFDKAKKIATSLTKRALPVAGKILMAGLLDSDDFSERSLADLTSDVVKDAVDDYVATKNLNKKFHESLSNAIEKLSTDNKDGKTRKNKIIIFVDEIDRCRPTFAIELLERIKHLFNVSNVIFILSVDKQQLNTSLAAVYGTGINAEEYLRRFIDLEFLLPKANTERFTEYLYKGFNFDNFFQNRNILGGNEKDNLIKLFNSLSNLLDLSLRAREQCFTRIRVGMMTTPDNFFFYPILLVTLVILKTVVSGIYKKYVSDDGTATDVLDYLRFLPGGNIFLNEDLGMVVESYLIAAKNDRNVEFNQYQEKIEDPNLELEKKARPQRIVNIIYQLRQSNAVPSLKDVINKIDLITQFDK